MNKGRPSKRTANTSKKRPSTTARKNRLSRADLGALQQLDRLLDEPREIERLAQMVPDGTTSEQSPTGRMPPKRLSPQDLPPGIVTSTFPLPGAGLVYCFVHERLGMLGNLILSPAGIYGTRVSLELAPGDPNAPEWAERYDLFNQVATTCLGALPGGDGTKALPSLENARTQQRLYQRFIACQHCIEMFGLVKLLAERDYHQLLAVV